MSLKEKFIEHKIYLHLAYWAGALLFFGTFWGSNAGEYQKYFTIEIYSLPVKMLVTYFTLYLLVPGFIPSKRYILFGAALLTAMITGGILQHSVAIMFIYPLYPPEHFSAYHLNAYDLMHTIVDINTLMVMPITAKIIQYYYQNKQSAEQLEKEKLQAELKFLKSQIHPHFLFNTLNSLYSLTLNNSKTAPDVVLKLSDLMRYMLYETNTSRVPLQKELEHLRSYVDLEKLRYEDRVDISFAVYGDIEGRMIPPMLLLPFIENSFKHGVSGETDCAWITIEISLDGEVLTMKVENSLPEPVPAIDLKTDEPLRSSSSKASGIGMKNVTRRLDLLFKDKYEMKTSGNDLSFLAVIKLNLG